MNPADKKAFIISLDGATFDILLPFMEQGYLPNLKRLMNESLSAQLESVIPAVTAPAWTSFMTGKNPSKHGLFGFTQFDPADNRVKLTNARDIRSKTIWQILSDKGKRCITVNLPYTTPPYPINGIMVAGWDSPPRNFTYPDSLTEQILQRFPDYRDNLNMWLFDYMPGKSEGNFDKLIDTLIRGCQQGSQLAQQFLDREPWDVFMVHFQQTDWIQHKVWGLIEEGARNPANKDARVERVRQCYEAFDEQVGILLRKVERYSPFTIVLSDHGFGDYKGELYPNYYLSKWGYYYESQAAEKDTAKPVRDLFAKSKMLSNVYRGMAGIKHRVDNILEFKRYRAFNSWVDFAGGTFGGRTLPVDWSRTKVATVGAYECAFLYVNMIGRNSTGIVRPEEYETIVSDLIERFSEVRHPGTGKRVYKQAARGSEIYPVRGADILLPDVILLPEDGYGLSSKISDALPEATPEGVHRHNGVVFLRSTGIKKSLPNFSPFLIDMAPTLLHALDMPVPSDMDGRVLQEIFVSPRNVQYEQVDNSVSHEKVQYLEAEAEMIEQRLKALGYVE
ncbi:MAG TPA: alkaline phosphatase family protein [Candidatus Binatia bacterium]|nr:alkaline phosphatase family protein [Candidatus Binatia bacterium]